eukprot:10091450-Heterocapsa_arctica.AAC.1
MTAPHGSGLGSAGPQESIPTASPRGMRRMMSQTFSGCKGSNLVTLATSLAACMTSSLGAPVHNSGH